MPCSQDSHRSRCQARNLALRQQNLELRPGLNTHMRHCAPSARGGDANASPETRQKRAMVRRSSPKLQATTAALVQPRDLCSVAPKGIVLYTHGLCPLASSPLWHIQNPQLGVLLKRVRRRPPRRRASTGLRGGLRH
jgi:hypothetical protein